MNNLKIACIQPDIVWEDKAANFKKYQTFFSEVSKKSHPDLILLPESFSTGFSMNTNDLAEFPDGMTFKWLQEQSIRFKASIMGSYTVRQNEGTYNRLVCTHPDSSDLYYNKRHLFQMGGEDKNFMAGEKQLCFGLNNWNIMPLICYDLRFPVWSRNQNLKYDLLVYVANWPSSRKDVWQILLKARAIENQCYVAGVNRVGTDGQLVQYAGNTMVVDYKGQIIAESDTQGEEVVFAELSLNELKKFREDFPVHLNADQFEIK